MILTSPSFLDGQTIPADFTCDGRDISPPLQWNGAPEKTAQFALLMDDPDAPGGTWSHWVMYGVPVNHKGLDENIPAIPVLPDGSCQGRNSWARIGYGGPCPPSGIHRYVFHLFALSESPVLESGLSSSQVLAAIRNDILAEALITGLYQRKR